MHQARLAREIRVPHLALKIECAPAVICEPILEAASTLSPALCCLIAAPEATPGRGKIVALQSRGASSGSARPSDDEGSGMHTRRASAGATPAISTPPPMRPALTPAGPQLATGPL